MKTEVYGSVKPLPILEKMVVFGKSPLDLLIERLGKEQGTNVYNAISKGANDIFFGDEQSIRDVLQEQTSEMTNLDKFKYLSNSLFEITKFLSSNSLKDETYKELLSNIIVLQDTINKYDILDNDAEIVRINQEIMNFIVDKFDACVDLQMNVPRLQSYLKELPNEKTEFVRTYANPQFATMFATATYISGLDTSNEEIINTNPYDLGVSISAGFAIDEALKTAEDARSTFNKIKNITKKSIIFLGKSTIVSILMASPYAIPGFLVCNPFLTIMTTFALGYGAAEVLEEYFGRYIDNFSEKVAVNIIKLRDKVKEVINLYKTEVVPRISETAKECLVFIAEKIIPSVEYFFNETIPTAIKSTCDWVKNTANNVKNKVKNFFHSFSPAF